MKKLLYILTLLVVTTTFAQDDTYWDGSLFFGMAIEHDDKLNNAIKGAPFGLLVSYNKNNPNYIGAKDYQKKYVITIKAPNKKLLEYFRKADFIDSFLDEHKKTKTIITINTTEALSSTNTYDKLKEFLTALQQKNSNFTYKIKEKTHTKNRLDFAKKYNYPDKGYSLIYQNFSSNVLGHSFGMYRHYNFFLNNNRNDKQHWFVKAGFGLAYNTKPYDAVTNNQNLAYGSRLMLSAFGNIGYKHEQLWDNVGVHAGLLLTHYSNGSFKNPNLGINTLGLNVGLTYRLDELREFPKKEKFNTTFDKKDQPIRYNFVARTGLNQSKEIGSELYSFYHFTGYASKRLNYYSTVTAGADYFISPFIRQYIPYHNATEFDNESRTQNTNRIGVFVGHELHFDYFSFVSQIGYHVHQPFEYVSSVYERFGFKHQINDNLFTELSLKVNLFRAEALEFGIGYRF